MVTGDLKEVDHDPCCNDCMKRCDKCKSFVVHILNALQKTRFKHRLYHTCTTPYMIYLAYCTKHGKQGVGKNESWKFLISNLL